MMRVLNILFVMIATLAISDVSLAQESGDTTTSGSNKMYVITKNDGTEYLGRILSRDDREILIEVKNLGKLYIPKHEIREIREIKPGELSYDGQYIPAEVFSTRYFITTNGLPIEKGENYIQWNLYGPDFQFGVGKNLGVGIMTSWIGIPVIGSAKYSFNLGEKINAAAGTLLGTGSWAAPDFGIALPFGALTFGDRRSNLNISAGYGLVWAEGESEGRALLSIAGMSKIGKRVSIVFDSFIVPRTSSAMHDGWALMVPGVRFQTSPKKAFQFGFAGIRVDGELAPLPIPMVQWYQKL